MLRMFVTVFCLAGFALPRLALGEGLVPNLGTSVNAYWSTRLTNAGHLMAHAVAEYKASLGELDVGAVSNCYAFDNLSTTPESIKQKGMDRSYQYLRSIFLKLISSVGQQSRLGGRQAGCIMPSINYQSVTASNIVNIDLREVASYDYEDELVFVIAHETSHLLLGHEWLRKAFIAQVNARRGLRIENLMSSEVTSFIYRQEMEADLMALWLMQAAGYNPRAGLTALLVMNRSEGRPGLDIDHPSATQSLGPLTNELSLMNQTALARKLRLIPAALKQEWLSIYLPRIHAHANSDASDGHVDETLDLVQQRLYRELILRTAQPVSVSLNKLEDCKIQSWQTVWDPAAQSSEEFKISLLNIAIFSQASPAYLTCDPRVNLGPNAISFSKILDLVKARIPQSE